MKTKTAKKAEKIGEKIGGVKVSDVNLELLSKKLTELGVKFSEDSDEGELLEVFIDWTELHVKELEKKGDSDYAECDECKAPCDPTWEYCPVCGAGYAEEPEEEKETELEKTVSPEENGALEVTGTLEDLDAAMSRIQSFNGDAMRAYYNTGRELSDIFRHRLYKTRVGDDGLPKYQSWDAFTQNELNMSGSRARVIMICSEQYTEEDFVKHGIEKLRTIARLAPPVRNKFLKQAESMTTRELIKAVTASSKAPTVTESVGDRVRDDLRQASSDEPDEGTEDDSVESQPEEKAVRQKEGLKLGTEAAREARERKVAAASGKALTAVFQLGDYELDMVQVSPASRDWKAKDVLVNGVEVTYYMHVKPDNSRVLKIKFHRPEEDE